MQRLTLTQNQKSHLLQWLVMILILESLLILFPLLAWRIFLACGAAFLFGFVLRLLNVYPGKHEPLILDLLSGILAVVGAIGCLAAGTSYFLSALRIAVPPLSATPHIIYIMRNRDIAASWYMKWRARQRDAVKSSDD